VLCGLTSELLTLQVNKAQSQKNHNEAQVRRNHPLLIPLCIWFCGIDAGFAVKYDGGTVTDLKVGTDIRINPSGTTITLSNGKTELIAIPAASITEISYGQDVHRRVGAAIGLAVASFGAGLLITPSTKYVTVFSWRRTRHVVRENSASPG
jgi:hypothetical protein